MKSNESGFIPEPEKTDIVPVKRSRVKSVIVAAGLTLGVFGKDAVAQSVSPETKKQKQPTEHVLDSVSAKEVAPKHETAAEMLAGANAYIEQSPYFSDRPQSVLSWTAALERPADYQAQEMIALEHRIGEEVKTRAFTTTTELLEYINTEIDSDFSERESSIFLKDAFPEKEGEKAKGSFDCDARAIMISSILQGGGRASDDVVMCAMQGHMMLALKNEGTFFETTTNKPIELSEDEQLQIDTINTFPKFFAHLISEKAAAVAAGADVDLISGKHMDRSQMDAAASMFQQANMLDPENITTYLNLIHVLSKSDDPGKIGLVSSAYENLLANLVAKYAEQHPDLSMSVAVGESKNPENAQPLRSPLSSSLRGSRMIQDQFSKYAQFSYYNAHDYKKSVELYKKLAESVPADKRKDSGYETYLNYMMKSYFNDKDFEKYFSEYDRLTAPIAQRTDGSTMGQLYAQDVAVLKAQKHVAELITGRLAINAKNFDAMKKTYGDDPILGPVFAGKEHWNAAYIDACEMLKAWKGYPELKKLIELRKEFEK